MGYRLPSRDAPPGVIPALFIIGAVSIFVNLFHAFPEIFRPFRPAKFPRSTKPAPHLFLLAAGIGQYSPSPAAWCFLPHPLQTRVPRVQVLLPLPHSKRPLIFQGSFAIFISPTRFLHDFTLGLLLSLTEHFII